MIPINNKALVIAYQKGWRASAEGKPKTSNPYPDLKTRQGRVTFSRAFRNYWERGYEHCYATNGKVRKGLNLF